MKRNLAAYLTGLLLLAVSLPSHAAINDFTLERFFEGDVDSNRGPCTGGESDSPICVLGVRADNASFEDFAREFGMIMSPRFLSPAETLGQAGFSIGMDASFNTIDNTKEHWQKASPEQGKTPSATLSTMQVHVRKGLPFSFELGGTMTKLFESDMMALGADVKWSFNEGFYYLPDVAVRGSVNRLIGNRDLDLLTGGVDVSVSHPFGIGGMLTLTPYAGWNLLYINASSHVLDATPGVPGFTPPYCHRPCAECLPDGTDTRRPDGDGGYATSRECEKAERGATSTDYRANFVLSRQRMTVHRGFVGLGIKVTVVSLLAEAVLAEEVQTYSLRLAMDF